MTWTRTQLVYKNKRRVRNPGETIARKGRPTLSPLSLPEISDFEQFQRYQRVNWEENIYVNAQITQETPLETNNETVKVVFIETSDPHMMRSIQNLYKARRKYKNPGAND